MSHELDMTRGRPAMAFTGEVPWHGLGARLSEGAALEVWQAEAGLDWEARKAVVRFGREAIDSLTGQPTTVDSTDPSNCVLYRSDSGLPLSIVSARYQPVQPREIIEFYRDLTERHGFTMETAGAIKEGRKIWALARTGETSTLPGNDHMRGYLLLATSFDGSMATQARFTSIRVVCNNTLTAASSGKADVSIRHNTSFNADDVKIARSRLGQIPGVTPLVRGVFSNTRQNHLYDNLVVHLPSTTECVGRSGVFNVMERFKLTAAEAELVSNHLPVYAEFSAYERDYTGGIASRRTSTR